MDQQQYSELCRSTYLALEISDTECLTNEGFLFIDDIRIQMMFDDIFSNDCILCITDIGEIPAYLKEKVFESLLMRNFLTGKKNDRCVCNRPHQPTRFICGHPDQSG